MMIPTVCTMAFALLALALPSKVHGSAAIELRPAKPVGGSPRSVEPGYNISLYYEGPASAAIGAHVVAQMKYPSILLENIQGLSTVDCSASGVTLQFGNSQVYADALQTWPSSSFYLFTNHLGDCDTEKERGLYLVDSFSSDESTLKIIASAHGDLLDKSASAVSISFDSAERRLSQRDLNAEIGVDWRGSLVNTSYLSLNVTNAHLSAALRVNGNIDLDITKLSTTNVTLDLSLDLLAELQVSALAHASFSKDVYNYNWKPLSISSFTIPGILDLGPSLSLGLGVEFATRGQIGLNTELSTKLIGGGVHLDFLNSSNTKVTAWEPTHEASTNISIPIDAQLNPYVGVEVAIGIVLFSGLVDLNAGIDTRASVVNEVSIDGTFSLDSETGVTFPQPAGACLNGAWFASDFVFGVWGFVTQFYRRSLWNISVPIYHTKCLEF